MNATFKASVSTSRSWAPEEAGREVVETALKELGKPPHLFLLYSTIHFDKQPRGMARFLESACKSLPGGVPLVGGTVAGFLNKEGCFTRGATGVAIYCPDADFAISMGRNTKKNPKKASDEFVKNLLSQIAGSKRKNKFLNVLISGGIEPQFMGIGRRRVLRGLKSKLAISLYGISLTKFQKGIGREDEILIQLTKSLPDFNIIGGSSMDDENMVENYQFFNNELVSNSLVGYAVLSDFNSRVVRTHNLKETDMRFTATKFSKDRRIVYEINGKPAAEELLRILGWSPEDLNEGIYRRSFFYPIAFKTASGSPVPMVIGLVLGSAILLSYEVSDPNMVVLSASGKQWLDAVDGNLKQMNPSSSLFGFVYSCGIILEGLGDKVFDVRKKLLEFYKEKPFLVVYVGGEASYTKANGLEYGNCTFVMSSICDF